MKHKLILMLKTLFASKGFSQKTLEGLADIVAPNLTEESTDEEIKTAVTGIEPYANLMQSEVTRVANEVANKPKPVETPKPVTTPVVETKPAEDMPEWAKALVTSTQALAQGLAAINGEKVTNTRREQIAKLLEGTTDAYKADKLADFDLMGFKDDESFDAYKTNLETRSKDFAKTEDTENGIGDTFRPTGSAGGNTGTKGEASQAEVDAAFKNFKL